MELSQESRNAIQLFKFIKEMESLSKSIKTKMTDEDNCFFLQDICNKMGVSLDLKSIYDDVDYVGPILTLLFVNHTVCPSYESILEGWIHNYDNFKHSPEVFEKKEKTFLTGTDQSEYEYFTDDGKRIIAFEEYLKKWNEWSELQKEIQKSQDVFLKFRSILVKLEEESEIYEMILGNGIVEQVDNSAICYPILTKRMSLNFDPVKNELSIYDTDNNTKLEESFINQIPSFRKERVTGQIEELNRKELHPLDGCATKEYLNSFIHEICFKGQYIEDDDYINPETEITIKWEPVLIVRKKDNSNSAMISDIIEQIDETNEVPLFIKDIVNNTQAIIEEHFDNSIEHVLAATGGEDEEILLCKLANREQLEIAKRIEQYNAVLVQGPPGTGKTHTIANLTGHFLSQGKTVLITSHTKKALEVLKDKLDSEIQNLCVSLIDDAQKEMNRSINSISDYVANHQDYELEEHEKELFAERKALFKELSEIRKKIFEIRLKNQEEFVFDGEGYSTIKLAKFVQENKEELSYLPLPVFKFSSMPLTMSELNTLYRSNDEISIEEENQISLDLPLAKDLVDPDNFFELVKTSEQFNDKLGEIGKYVFSTDEKRLYSDEDGNKIFIGQYFNKNNLLSLKSKLEDFENVSDWLCAVISDGAQGGARKNAWKYLSKEICDELDAFEKVYNFLIKNQIEIPDISSFTLDDIRGVQNKVENDKVNFLSFAFNKKLSELYNSVKINGQNSSKFSDWRNIEFYYNYMIKRAELSRTWDSLVVKNGGPCFASLGDKTEEWLEKYKKKIDRFLDWYEVDFADFKRNVGTCGFRLEEFDSKLLDKITVNEAIHIIFEVITKKMSMHIEAALLCNDFVDNELNLVKLTDDSINCLISNADICKQLIDNLDNRNVNEYRYNYEKLTILNSKIDTWKERNELLTKLSVYAPGWANAIRNREGEFGYGFCKDNIRDAWKWQQFNLILDDLNNSSIDQLQERLYEIDDRFRENTSHLASTKAWRALFKRLNKNPNMKSNLRTWQQAMARIGKGKGKNAVRMKKFAVSQMSECQEAVPAWIMPMSKAIETLSAKKNRFDIIIIDEASQSNLTALPILYMGSKIIVVGDNQQVSPLAIGADENIIQELRTTYLSKVLKNADLFDLKMSIYDVASLTFKDLMLKEHFRCVPEIIGYSNMLSYDNRIKPLRDASSTDLYPAIIPFRVDGQREGKSKVNIVEAETIVALITACMENELYKNKTIGVISLLGDAQVNTIQSLLFKKISSYEYENHDILVGNPAQFQGDERDVIFISMVDSSEGEEILHKKGEGRDNSYKQRYNVAVSRAKDQLWIVHSLDYKNCLKEGDLRRDLLEYAENPNVYLNKLYDIKNKSDSPFEEAVASALVARGYKINQQEKAGGYYIDIVVQYKNLKIALECDGERYHSTEEQVRNDMERQTILERIGWKFIRIRGSEYYLDSEKAMNRVCSQLEKYGIYPESNPNKNEFKIDEFNVINDLKIRAAQILNEWKEENND